MHRKGMLGIELIGVVYSPPTAKQEGHAHPHAPRCGCTQCTWVKEEESWGLFLGITIIHQGFVPQVHMLLIR